MSTKVRLSNTDRFIGGVTAINTYKNRKTNEQVLKQQYQNNRHLADIERQLLAANETNRQILQNQIREIEHKEEQKYYKALSFHINEIVEHFEKIVDPMVLNYALANYFEKVKNDLVETNNKLDEIADKLFNKQLLDKLKELKIKAGTSSQDFTSNVLARIDNLLIEFKAEEAKLLEDSNKEVYTGNEIIDEPRDKGNLTVALLLSAGALLCFGLFLNALPSKVYFFLIFASMLSLIAAFFIREDIKWKKGYNLYKEQQNNKRQEETNKKTLFDKTREQQTQKLKESLLEHPIYAALEEINSNHPTFETTTQEIGNLEAVFVSKWNPT